MHEILRLESDIGGRPLFQFLLCGERTILVDAGFDATPAETVLPALRRLGRSLDLVVITHADADHHGGIAALRAAFPDVTVGCGAADRALIESPEALIARRYEAYRSHGVGYPADVLASVREQVPPARVDVTWTGGEELELSPGRRLRVLALPGHSAGHIGLHDLRDDAVYSGDAVQGTAYVGGMPPNYIDAGAYLETIAALEALAPASLHGAHWPALEGPAVAEFLARSREAVERMERAVDALGDLGLRELIAALGPRPEHELMYAVAAHAGMAP